MTIISDMRLEMLSHVVDFVIWQKVDILFQSLRDGLKNSFHLEQEKKKERINNEFSNC